MDKYKNITNDEILDFLTSKDLSINGKTSVSIKYLSTWNDDALRRIYYAYKRTNNLGNIRHIEEENLPEKIDILTYSFPCQDVSIGGSWHKNMSGIGRNANNRSSMLWHVERILKKRKARNGQLPLFLLMENVKNLLSPRYENHFNEWKSVLNDLGYYNKVILLNAKNYGIPQNRERVYMVSILIPKKDMYKLDIFFNNYNKNKGINTDYDIMDFLRIDYNQTKYKDEANISNPNDTPSRQKIYEHGRIIYDGYKIINTFINTITTKQDRHPNAGLIEYLEHKNGSSKYRNLTPRECFLLMGFDEDDFENLCNNNFYIRQNRKFYFREKYERLAGNSIVVNVLMYLFSMIDDIREILKS